MRFEMQAQDKLIVMNYKLLLSLIICLTLTGCMSSFKFMTPDGEPQVRSRTTGQICQKLYDGYDSKGSYSAYGDSCQVEIWRKMNDQTYDKDPRDLLPRK